MTMPGVPYPTLPPDVQLHNLSYLPNPAAAPTALFMDAASNIVSLKPMQAATRHQHAPDNSNNGVHMMNGVQILPYAAHHPQSLPMAAVMPGVPGITSSGVGGSYIGHVPVPVIGNCVLNPCQPAAGIMAAPWVR